MATVKKKKATKEKPPIIWTGFNDSEMCAIEWAAVKKNSTAIMLEYKLTEGDLWQYIHGHFIWRRSAAAFFEGITFPGHNLPTEIIDDIRCLQEVLRGLEDMETDEDKRIHNRSFFQKVKEDGLF